MKFFITGIITLLLNVSTFSQSNDTYWWNDNVFYEIFVRSFYDSDGDGIGDFNGITQKLDHLNDGDPNTTIDLGVTGIWLMPINSSPSYHGYDITDFWKVNEDYGTLNDLKNLISEAGKRGIKVIMDLVLNHSSAQHPWFFSSTDPNSDKRDWYVWKDTNPGHLGPWGQPVWHLSNGTYYFGVFWDQMPDLNLENLQVKNELFDISRYWLEEVGFAGFRLDAIKHFVEDGPNMEHVAGSFEFLRDFRTHLKSIDTNILAVGEVFSGTYDVSKYVDGTGVDFCFDFEIGYAISNSIIQGHSGNLYNTMNKLINAYPSLQYAPFLRNHDQNRIFSDFSENMTHMKLAASIYLALPGIPFMYYGEEIGMIGTGDHENIRTPMQWSDDSNGGFTTGTPWQPLKPNYPANNVKNFNDDPESLLNLYRNKIATRNSETALRKGAYKPINTNRGALFSFARHTESEMIMVLNNLSSGELTNVTLSLSSTDFGQGSYSLINLADSSNIGTLDINENGGFQNHELDVPLKAYNSLLIKLIPIVTGINQSDFSPNDFMLYQNYPNPCNPTTTIKYQIPKNKSQLSSNHQFQNVTLKVYDILGKGLVTLVNEVKAPGTYEVEFSSANLPSKVYFYKLQAGSFVLTKKMILLK